MEFYTEGLAEHGMEVNDAFNTAKGAGIAACVKFRQAVQARPFR